MHEVKLMGNMLYFALDISDIHIHHSTHKRVTRTLGTTLEALTSVHPKNKKQHKSLNRIPSITVSVPVPIILYACP